MAARKHSGRKIRLLKKQRQTSPVPAWIILKTKKAVRTNQTLFQSIKRIGKNYAIFRFISGVYGLLANSGMKLVQVNLEVERSMVKINTIANLELPELMNLFN